MLGLVSSKVDSRSLRTMENTLEIDLCHLSVRYAQIPKLAPYTVDPNAEEDLCNSTSSISDCESCEFMFHIVAIRPMQVPRKPSVGAMASVDSMRVSAR